MAGLKFLLEELLVDTTTDRAAVACRALGAAAALGAETGQGLPLPRQVPLARTPVARRAAGQPGEREEMSTLRDAIKTTHQTTLSIQPTSTPSSSTQRFL